jgi:hypothetical protein
MNSLSGLHQTRNPALARELFERYQLLDDGPADLDLRRDVVELQTPAGTESVALNKHGFLARLTDLEQNVSLTRVELPRWMGLAGSTVVETVARSAQGIYSGFLADLAVNHQDGPSQDLARRSFYAWQKPLQKPGGDG